MTQWTALLLAGSRPGGNPFAADYGTDLKPLIPIGGKLLVAWPVAALLGAPEVGEVRVLTQAVERIAAVLPNDARLSVEASRATIAATLQAILVDPGTRFPMPRPSTPATRRWCWRRSVANRVLRSPRA